MDIYELIALRKSVRSYQPKAIENDKLDRVLDAGRMAPSARNLQEWRFIVVTEEKVRRDLAETSGSYEFIAQAPAVIVCCAETDQYVMRCGLPCFSIDVAIAMDHMTLAAVAEGLGTCWIGGFDAEKVKEILGIPEDIVVVEMLPIGYPENPGLKEKSRMSLGDIVRYEKW
ncbi:MAG: nitroreductase [Spirochaetales bacterium]|nr:nitroreductase [Spirochaetales bacterium]